MDCGSNGDVRGQTRCDSTCMSHCRSLRHMQVLLRVKDEDPSLYACRYPSDLEKNCQVTDERGNLHAKK
jgi:hypothetical protein